MHSWLVLRSESHFHLARLDTVVLLCEVWGVRWDHCHICANTAIHRSIFLPILILKRTCNLSSYIWLLFRSSHLIQCGSFGLGGFWGDTFRRMSQSYVKYRFKLPNLHTFHAGSLICNEVELNAVNQLLCDLYVGQRVVTGERYVYCFGISWCSFNFFFCIMLGTSTSLVTLD